MARFFATLIFCCSLTSAFAGDPTGYWKQQIAEGKAPPKAWWNNLASGKGLCCSFADGVSIQDVDWQTAKVCVGSSETGELECRSYYQVRVHGEWIKVPDTAVVKEPNRFGPAVVWPYTDADGTTQIRCFLAGAGA